MGTTSKLFTINFQDIAKGLLMAVIVPVIAIIEQSLQAGNLTFDWKVIGGAALAGGMGYLAKNFFTPSVITSPTNPVAK